MEQVIPGQRVAFAYEHQYRVLDVETVRETKEGNWIMTGIDPDKGEYRSFRLDRVMRGKVRVVRGGHQGAGEALGVPEGDRPAGASEA